MADLRIDLAAEFRGKKAFKEADKSVSALEKAVTKLGKGFLTVFAAQKIAAFGKDAVKAFMEDEKSAALLANTLKNLGLEFETTRVSDFIAKLEKSTGILDEQLRPALQSLLTTTGSITYAQKLLAQAIDISRGSSVDLATVTQDLANAYNGNVKGLKKYFTGLTNAQFAAMSFDEIMTKLNSQFSGASAAYLDTYAGKMSLINVAADNAKETIGKGLVDAFTILAGGGTDSLQKLIDGIDKVAQGIANVIVGAAYYIKKLFDNPIVQALLKTAYWLATHTGALSGIKRAADKGASLQKPKAAQEALTKKQQDLLVKQEAAAAAKAGKIKAAAAKAQAAKDLAIKKDGTIFDMQQIQLIAALKGKLSDEDRARAELQLALLNGNSDEADKLTKQILLATDATGNLYKYFLQTPDAKNPFGYLDTWIKDFQTKLDALKFPNVAPANAGTYTPAGLAPELAALGVVAGGGGSNVADNQYSSEVLNGLYGMQTAGSAAPTSNAGTTVNNYFGGNVVTDQALVDLIMNGTQLRSLSGSPSQIGRIAGMFG